MKAWHLKQENKPQSSYAGKVMKIPGDKEYVIKRYPYWANKDRN